MADHPIKVGMVMFPDITQLDLTGPLEVLAAVPGWQVDLVSVSLEPVRSNRGFSLLPTATFDAAPQYDVLVVPGGPGVDAAMLDDVLVGFIRTQGAQAGHIFGICTGSLLLAAAGLLSGRRAGCHWQALEWLEYFGVQASHERLTVDGHIFTSGGVTAGIDMALQVVGTLEGVAVAQGIQLLLEYDPEPPFNAGTPRTAPAEVVARHEAGSTARRAQRSAAVHRAVEKLAAYRAA